MYKDKRLVTIAETIVNYSLNVKDKDKVVISAPIYAKPLVIELINQIYKKGAYPYCLYTDEDTNRYIYNGSSEKLFDTNIAWNEVIYKEMDCYINIRSVENEYSLSNLSKEVLTNLSLEVSNLNNILLSGKKWCLLYYPTIAIAEKMKMTLDECTDYMFNSYTSDYNEISKLGNKLKEKLEVTNLVKIVSKETELTFNIRNCKVEVTDGRFNLPDGETALAPIKNSVNGHILINTISTQNGIKFEDIRLRFKDGKVIEASSKNNTDKLNEILDIDEGARYLGEFAFGLNPLMTKVVGIPIYGEKIKSSFHIALGTSLPGICDNTNRSAIH